MVTIVLGSVLLASLVLIVIGWVNPGSVLFGSKRKSRKQVIIRYGLVALASLAAMAIVSFGNVTIVSKSQEIKNSEAFVHANKPDKTPVPSEISKKSVKLTRPALKVKSLLDKNFNAVSGLTFTSDGMINAKVDGYSNLEVSQAKNAIFKKIWNVIEGMQGLKGIKDISLKVTYPVPSLNNETTNKLVMIVDYKMTTINEIDFKHSDSGSGVPDADVYWVSPALYGLR